MTQKRRNDAESRASHQAKQRILEGALENAADAVGLSTSEGRHFYQNRAFTDLFGVVGENPPATLYCDEEVGNEVFATIKQGGTWTGEVEMYARDRRVLSILLRAYSVKDDTGDVVGLVGIHTDITQRRRAEEALSLSEKTYREIFNAVNDTIWIHDIETFEFIDVNETVSEMFGYSPSEALKLTVEEISSGVPPYTQETAVEYLKKARAGEPQIFEWHTKRRNGGLFWTEVSLKRGTIAGKDCLLAIERDITERKRTEETIRRIHALESLGTVAGGIAHDFNNLLMGVFGNIELAKAALLPGHPALASLQAADRAIENARHLSNRLLTFAKGGHPVLEPVDLRTRISDTVQFHLSGSNVVARFDIPESLWPVRADKGQIAEVISNLTVNGRDAMPEGGTLHVSAENVSEAAHNATQDLSGDFVRLSVRDEGTGIPESLIDKVFEPYFSTKEGSGLGLSIVHGIVSRHRGHIDIQSDPGAGTTISILLPAECTEQSTPAAIEPPGRNSFGLEPKSILLVDDDENVRETTTLMIESLGSVVETAIDGKEAIQKYETAMKQGTSFDIVVMDLTIPGGMGGEETIGKLLALDPSAKVVVSSGYSSDPVLANYSAYGFAGRLAKPFTLSELTEVLKEL